MLLHGVIDSPDIPLNVSRSFLQADSNVKKINTYITRKVADKLSELYKKDRKVYEEKWQDIGLFVKYGMITDEKFFEKAKEFFLFTNTQKEHFTLEEYREKVAPVQTDKDGNVVYVYSNDPAKQDAFIQSAQGRSYDILLMDGPLDSHLISMLEQKLEKTQVKRVDSGTSDSLVNKGDSIASVLTEKQAEAVKSVFEKNIHQPGMSVKVEGLSADELPVTITMDEFMRRMKDMAAMGGGMNFYGSMPDSYTVTVNGNHPLINKIADAGNEEDQARLAKQAIDLALLSQGMLKGAELTAFVKRSIAAL